jgi:hypothetical protein
MRLYEKRMLIRKFLLKIKEIIEPGENCRLVNFIIFFPSQILLMPPNQGG